METNLVSKCQVLLQDMSCESANQLSRKKRDIEGLVRDIVMWLRQNESDAKHIFWIIKLNCIKL